MDEPVMDTNLHLSGIPPHKCPLVQVSGSHRPGECVVQALGISGVSGVSLVPKVSGALWGRRAVLETPFPTGRRVACALVEAETEFPGRRNHSQSAPLTLGTSENEPLMDTNLHLSGIPPHKCPLVQLSGSQRPGECVVRAPGISGVSGVSERVCQNVLNERKPRPEVTHWERRHSCRWPTTAQRITAGNLTGGHRGNGETRRGLSDLPYLLFKHSVGRLRRVGGQRQECRRSQ
jgi:hypothetical protein